LPTRISKLSADERENSSRMATGKGKLARGSAGVINKTHVASCLTARANRRTVFCQRW
jgi:hypothetical protein